MEIFDTRFCRPKQIPYSWDTLHPVPNSISLGIFWMAGVIRSNRFAESSLSGITTYSISTTIPRLGLGLATARERPGYLESKSRWRGMAMEAGEK